MDTTTTLDEKVPAKRKPAKPAGAAETGRAVPLEEAANRVRISFDISQELNERLQAMARDMNGTKSDVLRRSIALMEITLKATKEGQKVGFAERSDQLTTEIIGLRY